MSIRRRRLLLYAPLLFVAASVAIIYFGVEYIRRRNARFDEEVKARKGAVHRHPASPEWMDSKYLKPAARWLEPVLPARLTVIEKHADLARIRSLSSVQGLETLVLDRPVMTDSDLAVLSQFGGLNALALDGPQFTDACLDFLPHLPRLRSLSFNGSSLSNQSIPRLKALADAVRDENLCVSLSRTKVQLARDVKVEFPFRAQVAKPFDVELNFRLHQEIAQRWNCFIVIETRIFEEKYDGYVSTNQWSAKIRQSTTGAYSHTEKFNVPSPGDHEWNVRLVFIPLGRLMVDFSLATGRIIVDTPAPGAKGKSG